MLIGAFLVPFAFCGTVTSEDIPPTQQITLKFSEPPIPLQPYPYQEDLTSSIKFLKEGPTTKKQKVTSLMKLLKKVLIKYIDEIKANDEIAECSAKEINIQRQLEKDDLGQNNRILEVTEQTLVEEFKNDYEIVKEVKTEKIIEEFYDVVNETDKLNPLDDKLTCTPEDKVKNIFTHEFVEDGLLNYMQNFQSRSNCYKIQQENNVLERPEARIEEFIKPNVEQHRRNTKSKRRQKNKRKPFYIPCVKASDILEEPPKYEPKEVYHAEYIPANVNSKAEEIQSTLERPVEKYITYSDSDDTVALLFKPKSISLMQAYGNLLKKITVTVLVPFHVTKLALQN